MDNNTVPGVYNDGGGTNSLLAFVSLVALLGCAPVLIFCVIPRIAHCFITPSSNDDDNDSQDWYDDDDDDDDDDEKDTNCHNLSKEDLQEQLQPTTLTITSNNLIERQQQGDNVHDSRDVEEGIICNGGTNEEEQQECMILCCRVEEERMHFPPSCAICLSSYEVNDVVTYSPNREQCKHAFHEKCILSWLSSSNAGCPCCRQPFLS